MSSPCCGGSVQVQTGQKDIKKIVQSYYSDAVQKRSGGCCAKSETSANAIAKKAGGYQDEVLSAIPQEAAEKSFGCGDPLAFAGVQPGQTVLDIGSGAGIDCFIAAQKVGSEGKVIGLDMTPAMLEAARKNAAKGNYTNVEFRQGEAENMPLENASVDWVISNCVINLSPDKAKVFSEINRVLKPGGRVSITDIVADHLPEFVKSDASSYCGCLGGAIPEAEYLRLLSQAGLVDVSVDTRIDYSPDEIRNFINEDEDLRKTYGTLMTKAPELVSEVRVSSIKVIGRKPAADEVPEVQTRAAESHDLAAIDQLLQHSGLPFNGFADALPDALVALQNGQLVGVIALERFGKDGLVRSFAVATGWRKRGLGKVLWNKLIDRARETGIASLYLLTNTIADMAGRAGFKSISREQVPAALKSSVEFTLSCCNNAETMRLDLLS